MSEKTLWVVGEFKETSQCGVAAWEFCGVFDNEEIAIKACKTQNHFIAPVLLNVKLIDEETTEWPGLYYPNLTIG